MSTDTKQTTNSTQAGGHERQPNLLSRLRRIAARRWPWIAVIGLLLVALAAWALRDAVGTDSQGDATPTRPQVGYRAPDFTLPRLDDDEVTLSDLRGQLVVFNFCATFCQPCRAGIPDLQPAYEERKGEGLTILAVDTTFQDSESSAEQFVQDLALDLPILLDRSGDMSRSYELRAMPTTLFIDRQGIVQEVILGGPMSEQTIDQNLDQLLGAGD
jgi:peroxiredoxin